MGQQGFLILGRVVRPYGVRGEVMMACFADSWEPFRTLTRVWVGPTDGPFRPLRLERAQAQDRAVVLKLAGVETPEGAAGLVGYEVTVPRVEAPSLPEGVFYHYDVLGLEVWEGDRSLGTVCDILETPAHDVYVIQGPAGEWMLPAARAHIRRIDPTAGRIEIKPGTDLASATSGGEESAEAV
ncbi:MAG: ribosome maturation factor RimM [Candidatus Methylomirabilota bacterium]|jgi:16S rRNA processing protein RimM